MAKRGQKPSAPNDAEKSQDRQPKPDGAEAQRAKRQRAMVAVQSVADEFDADVIVYNGPIDEDGFGLLVGEVAKTSGTRKNCLLILVTYGGLANSAYRIGRFLQTNYDKFFLFVPSYCKSAGTIIALGCSAIIMSEFGELGPLDVQLFKQDEIGERKSGLLSKSAFDALGQRVFELFESVMIGIKQKSGGLISFQTASNIAGEIAANVFQPIYAQINPDVIGDDHRDLQVAYHYGLRLALHGENVNTDQVAHLVERYPSHDFVIDLAEARGIFDDIREPSEALYALYELLGSVATQPLDDGANEVRLISIGLEPTAPAEGPEPDGGTDESAK